MAIALATLAIGGCSHGTVSELPTAPAPRLLKLTITPVGGGTLIAGGSAPITSEGPFSPNILGALGQYFDGSNRYVPANWSTSDPAVLAVDGASLIAIRRGTATLTASSEGVNASETFIVEPGIAGAWSGAFVTENCQAGSTSMIELLCGEPGPGRQGGSLRIGTTVPITFQITQAGNDLTATTVAGEVRGTLTGRDRGQNFLSLLGDLTNSTTQLTVFHWDAQVRTDTMEGFIGFEVRIPGVPGFGQVSARLADVTRR
jgi:hypothetical protein